MPKTCQLLMAGLWTAAIAARVVASSALVGGMQPGFLLPLAIPEGDSNYDDKADIVELNGLQESYEFTLHPDRPPDKAMIAFLRLINIQGEWYPAVGNASLA